MALRNVQELLFSRGGTETGLTAAKEAVLFGTLQWYPGPSEIVERVGTGKKLNAKVRHCRRDAQ
jgi:hypothetical protein